MKSSISLVSLVGAGLMLAAPSFAQTAPVNASSGLLPVRSVDDSRLAMVDNGWRSSKIVGSTVYNDTNQSIGEIDDLIVDASGKITDAVISVGGFLGIDAKSVKVSYSQLRFEKSTRTVMTTEKTTSAVVSGSGAGTTPTVSTNTGAPLAPAGAAMALSGNATAPTGMLGSNTQVVTVRIVLPGVTKDQLGSMPKFSNS